MLALPFREVLQVLPFSITMAFNPRVQFCVILELAPHNLLGSIHSFNFSLQQMLHGMEVASLC